MRVTSLREEDETRTPGPRREESSGEPGRPRGSGPERARRTGSAASTRGTPSRAGREAPRVRPAKEALCRETARFAGGCPAEEEEGDQDELAADRDRVPADERP